MLNKDTVAEYVLNARPGSISVITGARVGELRELLGEAEPRAGGRIAMLLSLTGDTAESIVARTIGALAQITLSLWPVWYNDVALSGIGRDTVGREAARLLARRAADRMRGVQSTWTEAAAALALDGRSPRVPGIHAAIELKQLCLAINRGGLVFLSPGPSATDPDVRPCIHAAEWIASHADAPVIIVFDQPPANAPPLDRILYGARHFAADNGAALPAPANVEAPDSTEIWIAPILGRPHPLSETEERLAKALANDLELAPLFCYNQCVETVRGSRPRVDLVWTEGRLIVELDGYADHGTRLAFMHDRHRDYELTLSGYTVLRLANDEIAQDIGKAIDKIRDLVRMRLDGPKRRMPWPITS